MKTLESDMICNRQCHDIPYLIIYTFNIYYVLNTAISERIFI